MTENQPSKAEYRAAG